MTPRELNKWAGNFYWHRFSYNNQWSDATEPILGRLEGTPLLLCHHQKSPDGSRSSAAVLGLWVAVNHVCEQRDVTQGLVPPLAGHPQQGTAGTGSACVLQIETIQMQAPGITSWRILSNRLCFHALFIHIYVSVKMASFELIDAFLWAFVRNQYCTSPASCYSCSFVSSQVPNNCKFSYLRQISSK